MKRKHSLLTMGLASALLAGCQSNRMTSNQYAAAYPPPTHSRLRIKTEPVAETRVALPAPTAPTAPTPTAPAPTTVTPGVSRGFITETPASVPHGTTPVNSRPADAVERTAPDGSPTAPTRLPPSEPGDAPTLPPPPVPSSSVPSSRIAPGTSKGAVDPNTPETIIVMSQTDSGADRSLMLVKNNTAPAAAQIVNAGHATPTEGVSTITGEAQQFRRTWRLRYAPLDAEDAQGGSVTLVGEGLDRIREGQQIRVVGILHPAVDRGDSPRFEVQFLEVLSR